MITVKEMRGKCRWCGCTDTEPCEGGCGWANRAETLCTECVEVDRLVRTAAGRRDILVMFHSGRRIRYEVASEFLAKRNIGSAVAVADRGMFTPPLQSGKRRRRG